jgi:hypothetical protein
MLLSAAGAGVQVAADDQGDAVVVWVEGDGGDLMAIARAAGEPFSTPQKVATGVHEPQLAVSRASGEAWLAWIQSEQNAMPRTYLATRPSRGSFSAGAAVPGNVATEWPTSPRVAATATGAALVSWHGAENGGAGRVRATRIRDGSAPVVSEVATGEGGGTYFAGLSDAGRGVLAFGGGSGPVMGALTPPDGSFGQAQTLFPYASGEANGAAVDNAGNALVFWAASGMENVSVSPAGAADAFCSPMAIVPNGAAGPVSMALDAGGNGVAVFQRNGSSEVLAVDYRQESGCPSPPVVAPVAVKQALVRVGSRVVVTRSGRSARMTLACRAGAACNGSVVLTRGSGRSAQPAVTLGRRSFSIAAGESRTVRISLSLPRRAVRMLRSHQRVRATATVRLRGQVPVQRAVVLAST